MIIRNEAELKILKTGGKILHNILEILKKKSKAGISTQDLADIAQNEMRKNNVKPCFLNYRGFPSVICTSLKNEIVHGIPKSSVILKDGDILRIDAGINYAGLLTDSAITVVIGKTSKENQRLIKETKYVLDLVIKNIIKPGIYVGEIGRFIEDYITKRGLFIIKEYNGHGIGLELHEPPLIPNFYTQKGEILKEGEVLAIEPIIGNNYDYAHFEHTIVLLKNKTVALT